MVLTGISFALKRAPYLCRLISKRRKLLEERFVMKAFGLNLWIGYLLGGLVLIQVGALIVLS